jgi:hypothetical protein
MKKRGKSAAAPEFLQCTEELYNEFGLWEKKMAISSQLLGSESTATKTP